MAIIALAIACVSLFAFTACGNNDSGNGNSETKEKNVTVIAREQASGTREAFDKVVTDGNGNFLNMKDANGKTVYSTTSKATLLDGTGAVLSSVASDENAIGYISLGSVDDTVKVVKVNGVAPSKATVLDGTYSIQRPFVVMTNKAVTLTPLAEDFLKFLKSSEMQTVCDADGVIFLTDEAKRANEGEVPIAVETRGNSERKDSTQRFDLHGKGYRRSGQGLRGNLRSRTGQHSRQATSRFFGR